MKRELAVGIDIGGTNTSFGLVTRDGHIVAQGTLPTATHRDVHEFVATLAGLVSKLLDEVQGQAVGIGTGAPTGNYITGAIVNSPNLPWKGVVPFARLLSEATSLPVHLTNDAKAAAIGEMQYGAARGMQDFLMVTLGTGLGSGFVANGRLIYGHDGMAGELGHTTAVPGGRQCGCGRLGCLETYVSATGIVRTAHEWLSETSDESILRKLNEPITAKAIQTAAQQGDRLALEMYDYTGSILGRNLADAVAVTSPEAIIFFGGLAKGKELILDPTRRYFEESLLHLYKGKVKFLLSALNDADAAILGASALVW